MGVGLSMDAFAVAVCKGLAMRKINYRHMLIVALMFGGFQALMPLVGWTLGRQFERYITAVDHWIAFGLLVAIGGNMIWSVRKESDQTEFTDTLNLKQLLLMAVATSIDALAVGITFAFLNVDIFLAIGVIGATTFCLSIVGVFVGNRFGNKYQNRATVAGGVVLILLGIRILLEHLGIFSF